MEKAQKNYRRARRMKRCGPPVMVLSWVLTVALIVIGTGHMDRFSLFMVFALLVCAAGTVFYFVTILHCGNKAVELARHIAALDASAEEKFRMAAECHLEQLYINMQLLSYPKDE